MAIPQDSEHAHSHNALDSFLPVMSMGQITSTIWTCPVPGWISRNMWHLQIFLCRIAGQFLRGGICLTGGYTYQRGIGTAAVWPYPEIR